VQTRIEVDADFMGRVNELFGPFVVANMTIK